MASVFFEIKARNRKVKKNCPLFSGCYLIFYTNTTSTKVPYFAEDCYRTSFQGCKVIVGNGASVASAAKICMSALLLLML
jgi:hypothetical protein